MSKSDGSETEDTIERRIPESRVKLWILLSANRWSLSLIVLGGFFLALLVLGVWGPEQLSDETVTPLFEALVAAVITGVTIVVTINQLVLSQELGTAGEQRDRMEGAMTFRKEIESVLDEPISPPDPGPFLAAIVSESAQCAQQILNTAENTDEEIQTQLVEFADELQTNARSTQQRLDTADFGTFQVLDSALDYNYSRKLYEARRLTAEHDERLNDETREALSDVAEILELYGAAREHFKTLYFQWELINLSRSVLYASIPALFVSAAMILFVEPETVTGTILGIDNLILLTGAAFTVALLPFMLLLTYVLRIMTVAKRTLAIGPFILRTTDRSERDEK